jgi:hypothetical protein
VHAGSWAAYLQGFIYAAAGDGDLVFLHHASDYLFRVWFSDQYHAAVDAVHHLCFVPQVLPGRAQGTYLKGVVMDILWPQMLAMLCLGLGFLTVAVLRFHKVLD